MINWPQPTHVPVPGGSQLNPRRVDDLMAAIKQELVAGEMIDLAQRIMAEFAEDEGEPQPDPQAEPEDLGACMKQARDAEAAAYLARGSHPAGARIACSHCGETQRLEYLECTECGKCGDVRITARESRK